jgi:hypothetical protein
VRGIVAAILALLLFGAVAGVAYEAGLAAAGAGAPGAATAAYPYYWHPGFFGFGFFGFLFPLLFLFLIFGLLRAAFGGGHWGGGYGRRWGGPRMLDEWHRELHEREKTGAGPGPDKAER